MAGAAFTTVVKLWFTGVQLRRELLFPNNEQSVPEHKYVTIQADWYSFLKDFG